MLEINQEPLSLHDYEVMLNSLQKQTKHVKRELSTYKLAYTLLYNIVRDCPDAYRHYLDTVGLNWRT